MISVIIPTYNRGKIIEKSIASVLAQTYRDLELIVVDDGSTDNTEDLVKAIADDRVRYIRQKNQGACAARNLGVQEARGEFIAFQDSDDTWKPDKLFKQIRVMQENPEVGIVCCRTICERVDNSSFISLEKHPGGIISRETGPYGISTQTLLVRKAVFDHLQFDTKVTRYQDLDFLLCAMKQNVIVFLVPEILVERRHEADSISNHPERIYDMSTYFQEKHADIMADPQQRLSKFLCNALIDAAQGMSLSGKIQFYKKSFALQRSPKTAAKIVLALLKLRSASR